MENREDSDQIALTEVSWSGSKQLSKQDISGLNRTRVYVKFSICECMGESSKFP